jgi:small subunit ribosomal protein S6
VSVAEASEVKEHLYEGMFLVDSNAYANDPDSVTAELMQILEKAGARVIAHRPWQDGKLAYEIEGRRKGLHYIVCFKMVTSGMDVITRQCHLNDTVLRQMIVSHPEQLFNAVVNAITPVEEVPAEPDPVPAEPAPVPDVEA